METLLGLDVGTTSTKAVLYDLTGAELARAVAPPYRNHTPRPGWVEQDPEEIWQAVLTAVRGVMAQASAQVEIHALCLAAQSGSLLAAGANGEVLYPLITWMDGRTEQLVRQWRKDGYQERIKPISGSSLYPGLCLPTIAWLRQNNPQIFAAARHYFSVNDFIAYRLTGQYCTNPSNGGGMQLVDIHSGIWSSDLCSLAGITPGQLSPIQPTATLIAEIRPEVCRDTGLTGNPVLVNGGHDQGCTAIGLGVMESGELLLACGTAWVITGVVDSLTTLPSPPATLDLNFHPAPGRWTISQSLGGLGASLEWWVNQAWPGIHEPLSRQEIYAALDDEMSSTAAQSRGPYFLPMTGGHDDPATTQYGAFMNLQLGNTRADMARAIMESAAFELRWALSAIQNANLPVEKLWMVGGAAQSSHWPAILADVLNIPIYVPQYDNWPALGAAILAGVGLGLFDSIEDGQERFQKSAQRIATDESLQPFYDAGFVTYKRLMQYVER
jgi:xylulokinase